MLQIKEEAELKEAKEAELREEEEADLKEAKNRVAAEKIPRDKEKVKGRVEGRTTMVGRSFLIQEVAR